MELGEEWILFPTNFEKHIQSNGKGPPIQVPMNNIHTNFVAKRNSAKINSYFINMKYTIKKTIIIFCFGIFSLLALNVFFSKFASASNNYIDQRTLQLLLSKSVYASIQVSNIIKNAVFLSNLYSDLLSDSPIIDLSRDNAPSVIRMLDASRKASNDKIFWWDMASITGEYFSLSAPSDGPNMNSISYGKMSEEPNQSYNIIWRVKDVFPSEGYPNTGYDRVETDWSMYDQPWFLNVMKSNRSLWIPPYLDYYFDVPIIMVSYSSPFFIKGKFNGTASHTITIRSLKNILFNLSLSENSKLALLDQHNNLIVSTSSDPGLEINNETLVSKDLTTIDDPVWKCASGVDVTKPDVYHQMTCTVKNDPKRFFINNQHLIIDNDVKWKIIGAICLSDFTKKVSDDASRSIVRSNLWVAILFILVGIYMLLRVTIVAHFQKNNLYYDSKNNFQEDLDEIIQYTNSRRIINDIFTILRELSTPATSLYYNITNVFKSIQQSSLRQEFIEKFSIVEPIENTCLSFRRQDDNDLLIYRGGTLTTYDIPRKIIANNKIRVIIRAFESNNNELLFQTDQLNNLLAQILHSFDSKTICLVSDSFNLLSFLIANGCPALTMNNDLIFSMLFINLVYHIVKYQQKDIKTVGQKYFIEESESAYIVTDDLLDNFKNIRLKTVEYDFKHWKKITNQVMRLLNSLFVNEHLTLPTKFLFMTKDRYGTFTKTEEITLCSIILIISQYSYFLIDEKSSNSLLELIRSDTKFTFSDYLNIEKFIKSEVLSKAIEAIESVIHPNILEPILNHFCL